MNSNSSLIDKTLMNTLLFLLFILISGCLYAQNSTSKHFKVESMSEGVYAIIHSPGGYAICNAGIVNLGEETLVFDTFLAPGAALDLLKIAVELTGNPVKYVINSHYHNDHIRGNQVFKPSATIISTAVTRELMAENEPKEILQEQEYAPQRLTQLKQEYDTETDEKTKKSLLMWIGYFEAMVESHAILKTTLPDVTFSKSLSIHGSQREAQLFTFDLGHTASDLILYLPAEKIVFAGDLLFIGMHPYLADGNTTHLIQDLMQLKTFDIEKVLPGHGEVGISQDIDLMIKYVNQMNSLVERLAAQNVSSEELEQVHIPEPFDSWEFSNFFRLNLKFMFNSYAR